MKLPRLEHTCIEPIVGTDVTNILIASEGFEERSLAWIRSLPSGNLFNSAIILKNIPERKSRLEELLIEVARVCPIAPEIIDYQRYDVEISEASLKFTLDAVCLDGVNIYLDISVMSRVLIVILLCLLNKITCNLHIIYSEPEDYSPTQSEFYEHLEKQQVASVAPSSGVRQVIRTPLLSSSVMQDAPIIAVGFTSFNEQLLRALLSSLNPSNLVLINAIPPTLFWRAQATLLVHKDIVFEYNKDNPISDDGLLSLRASTLYYQETVSILVDIYLRYCFTHRIVVVPTGSKMQALACGIVKACCHDIHIEYPTAESYFIENYSSSKIKQIHHISINNYPEMLSQYAEAMGLNG